MFSNLKRFAILGFAGWLLYLSLLHYVAPVSSLALNVTREQAIARATDIATSFGMDIAGHVRSCSFIEDSFQVAYLQKNLGLKRADAVIAKDGLPVYGWLVRWFRSLEKEEVFVSLDPRDGRLRYFEHIIKESAPGADLSQDEAKGLAVRFLDSQGIDIGAYDLVKQTTEKMPARSDHDFTWELRDYKIGEATQRIDIRVQSDEIGYFSHWLKVPEAFVRMHSKELSLGQLLTMISAFVSCVLLGFAFVVFLKAFRADSLSVGFGNIPAAVVVVAGTVALFNRIPLELSNYKTLMGIENYLLFKLGISLFSAILLGCCVWLLGVAAENVSHQAAAGRWPLLEALRRRVGVRSVAFETVVRGYSLAGVILAAQGVFYWFGSEYLGIWAPAGARYSNMLGTYVPILVPLTVSLTAALSEEIAYRFFAVPYITRRTKNVLAAGVLASVIWAFTHSNYPIFPVYVRGIELTLIGLIFVWGFWRFGIESAVIAHFVIDAFVVSLPLFWSGNVYYRVSAGLLVCLALLPLLFGVRASAPLKR